MVTFHYVEFKTYCHATEAPEKVEGALENTAGEEIEIDYSEAEGYYGNRIIILESKIERNREMDAFFDKLPESTIDALLKTLERRIDERCNFFFRLDKERAFLDEPELSEGENTIKVRARVESYPSKKETAVEKMKEYLGKRTTED